MNRWYRLDNAAKVFPSVSSKKRSNIFRLSFTMTEDVDKDILQTALEATINRFPVYNVKLKKGFFWYYFEENEQTPQVIEESPHVCENMDFKEHQNFMFALSYYKKRITMEMFHSLTDGGGALEFFKSIVFKYLLMMGKPVQPEKLILSDVETRNEESQDSFVHNYSPKVKANRKELKALKITKGTRYQNEWNTLVQGTMDLAKIKELSKKYDLTITEFISTCLIYSASRSLYLFEDKDRPFQCLVPVNLRRFFPSKTLRNFSLFIRTSERITQESTFEEIARGVKADFGAQLQKTPLHQLMMANVRIEKNLAMRLVPLFIKTFVLKIGYKAFGDSPNSICYSNMGSIELPRSMVPYVSDMIFANGSSVNSPVNVASLSYEDKFMVGFTSSLLERDIQREFFRLLASFGVEVVIMTNELEV
jgi:NRPS condensation-like uncharacterized protein